MHHNAMCFWEDYETTMSIAVGSYNATKPARHNQKSTAHDDFLLHNTISNVTHTAARDFVTCAIN